MARLDTDLIGLPIVSMEDARVVAEVDALVIDDATLTVAGFLANVGLYEATILPYQAARAVGEDAIIIRSVAVLAPLSSNPALAALAERDIVIAGSRVVTLTGQEAGSTGGYYVDDRGRVVGLEFLATGAASDDEQEPPLVPVSFVHRVGPDLVVLKQEYLEHLVRDPALLDRPAPKATPTAAVPSSPPSKPPRTRTRKPAAESLATVETPGTAAEAPPSAAPAEPPVLSKPAAHAEHPAAAGTETSPSAPESAVPARAASRPSEETGPARHFLVGRRVTRRIEDSSGETIAEEGDIVTQEMIQLARERDQLLILSLNVE